MGYKRGVKTTLSKFIKPHSLITSVCVYVCVCVCVCVTDKVELLVVPGDQTIGKGEDILLPCVSVSIGANVSTALTWTRRKPGSQGSRGDDEILTNTTDRVTIFHTREERASGAVVMKSVLHLGCVEFEDKGTYSCHVASTAVNKTVDFLVDVKGMDGPNITVISMTILST